MLDWSTLFYFITASAVITLAPGPDIIFLITQSINHGVRAGVATALGLSSGNLIHTLAVPLGISIIFQTSTLAFEALKIFGVCYLLYLAYGAIVNTDNTPADSKDTHRSLYMRGVLMNVLNPKVALFFIAFLPQFVTSDEVGVELQMIFYGLTFTLIVVVIFTSISLFAGKAANFFNHSKSKKSLNFITALIFVALAINLFFFSNKSSL